MSRAYAYASAPDVLAHLTIATAFTATSRPNATQVHSHLINASNDLDLALRTVHYTVPIATTATGANEQLRTWTSIGAAMFTTAGHPAGRDSKHLEFLERQWNSILTGIRDGNLTLADASLDSTVGQPRSPRSSAGVGASAFFTRDNVTDF
jgi:hypothetical protein